jgi:hypothetical protein
MRLTSINALGFLAAALAATAAVGCGGSSSNGGGSNGTTSGGSILQFAAGANGSATPIATLTTDLAAITALATDSSGRIYVAGLFTGSSPVIEVYAAGASGAATPMRTISGTATGLVNASAISVDGAGNIFVAHSPQTTSGSYVYTLDEFAASATGNVAPISSFTSTSWTAGLVIALR